jgi:hypothetical protein
MTKLEELGAAYDAACVKAAKATSAAESAVAAAAAAEAVADDCWETADAAFFVYLAELNQT